MKKPLSILFFVFAGMANAQTPVAISLTGNVSSVPNPHASGPFVGAAAGDAVSIQFEVVMPALLSPPGTSFHDLVVGSASVVVGSGSVGGITANSGFGLFEGFPTFADVLVVDFDLGFPSGQVSIDLEDSTGLAFNGIDLATMNGVYPVSDFDTVSIEIVAGNGLIEVDLANLTIGSASTTLGITYCANNANSTGQAADLSATGSIHVAANDLTLVCSNMPTNQFGYFLRGESRIHIPTPGGSQGNFCVGGSLGRFNRNTSEILFSGQTGSVSLTVDLTNIPTPAGTESIMAGQTRTFQCWHRDQNPSNTSNFSNGLEILFL